MGETGKNKTFYETTIIHSRLYILTQITEQFKQILIIATESGVLKIGNVSFDGTKFNANASKHKAMRYGHASKLEQKIKEAVALLMEKAQEKAGKSIKRIGISVSCI
jgi:hypothetical protein